MLDNYEQLCLNMYLLYILQISIFTLWNIHGGESYESLSTILGCGILFNKEVVPIYNPSCHACEFM